MKANKKKKQLFEEKRKKERKSKERKTALHCCCAGWKHTIEGGTVFQPPQQTGMQFIVGIHVGNDHKMFSGLTQPSNHLKQIPTRNCTLIEWHQVSKQSTAPKTRSSPINDTCRNFSLKKKKNYFLENHLSNVAFLGEISMNGFG